MPAPANLVHQTATSTGAGNFTLAKVSGKNDFATAFTTGGTNVFDYFISNRDAAEWERGTGHMDTTAAMVRDTVIQTHAGTTVAIDFTAGTKDVTNDVPALDQARISGANTFTTLQAINTNLTASPSTLGTPTLRLIAADGVQPRLQFEGWAAAANFVAVRTNGTSTAPTALSSGDQIFQISGHGHNGSGYHSAAAAALRFFAADNFSSTGQPSRITFMTNTTGSPALTERLRIEHSGALVHRNNATTFLDANSHIGLRTYPTSGLPSASTAGHMIYVSDGAAGSPVVAFSNGTNWLRVDTLAAVSSV